MIRIADKADIPVLMELMQSEPGFWKQLPRPDALDVELASAGDLAVVWEDQGRILAYACAHDLGFRGYLSELIVAPAARHRGIGRRLVEHIEQTLHARGCPLVFSDVWRSSERFYRSLGWYEPDVTLLLKRLGPQTHGLNDPAKM